MPDGQDTYDNFSYLQEKVRLAAKLQGIERPTPPQQAASPLIARGENVLIIAPTGSGKTEAALLPLLSRMLTRKQVDGISILYLTPMRALNRDLLKRLQDICTEIGFTIQVRHGDTPRKERMKQSQTPPDLLISTPETLQAILPGRRMRKHLSSLLAVVVDELHELLDSKRGTQLAVALERLRELAPDFQLIALSATVGNPEDAARFIFGSREHRIVNVEAEKRYNYIVRMPVADEETYQIGEETYSPPDLAARLSLIDRLIETHSSTLIFVNSRTIAEMLGEKLSRIRKDVAVHHGSLPREERERVENAFKSGRIKALVCTSTMELGIDIGSVELVVQYMSPRQVASLLQRVGRSGHRIGRLSRGEVIAVSAEDVLESCAVIGMAKEGRIEETSSYKEPLDVLAHQIAGYLMDFGMVSIDSLLEKLRRATPYVALTRETLNLVINYLHELGKLRFEKEKGLLQATRGTREYYFGNLSMIPDEIRYLVIDAATNEKIGILGEEFVLLHAKVGVHIILKGRVWQIEKIADDRKIYVTSIDDPLAAVPGWDGELLPIPERIARETGRLRQVLSQAISSSNLSEVIERFANELHSDAESISKVVEELDEHIRMGAPVPSDRLILVEGFEKYLIIHLCFGEKINRTFALTFEEYLSRKGLVRLWWADGYRVLFELTVDAEEIGVESLSKQLFSLSGEQLEELYRVAAQRNFPFPERVKVIAERFGAINRGRYISHPNLCSLPTRFENTPVYIEAMKETSLDKIDLEGAKKILKEIALGNIQLAWYQSKEKPTPIAYHMLYRYLEFPESVAPESLAKSTVQRMKLFIMGTSLQLLCLKCANLTETITIRDLAEEPRCQNCGSGLLSPLFYQVNQPTNLVKKKLSNQSLTAEERDELARLRRMADLVLSYGKKGVEALSVYGIGPQTASRILARMAESEDDFYRSLLDAKLKFIATRPFWQDSR
ncbi:MAG: DEAD/DEAH box helicase [Conexivisphaerales archaeon]